MLNNSLKSGGLGNFGEELAEKYLRKRGYFILEKNYCNPNGRRLGEIDIIAKEGRFLVFFEVKTRLYYNSLPEDSINKQKLKKLSKIINFYISRNNFWHIEWRLDAISIVIDKGTGKYKLSHLKNIFL